MVEDAIRFSGATIQNVNIYRTAPGSGEKFLDGIQAKLTTSQKEALRRICADNGMDMSTFAREAISFYLDLWPYREKINRHHRLLRSICARLS